MLEALQEISIVLPGRPEEKSREKSSHDSPYPIPNTLEGVKISLKISPLIDQDPSIISDRNLEPSSGSSVSIASSFDSSAVSSEKGTETEEEEGMVLVGRPS